MICRDVTYIFRRVIFKKKSFFLHARLEGLFFKNLFVAWKSKSSCYIYLYRIYNYCYCYILFGDQLEHGFCCIILIGSEASRPAASSVGAAANSDVHTARAPETGELGVEFFTAFCLAHCVLACRVLLVAILWTYVYID